MSSGRRWFGFVLSEVKGGTNAAVLAEVKAALSKLGTSPSIPQPSQCQLAYAVSGTRGFLRVEWEGQGAEETHGLHQRLEEAGLGAQLARSLSCDVWSYTEAHEAEWEERAHRYTAGSGAMTETLGGTATEVMKRLGWPPERLNEDETQEKVARELGTNQLALRLNLSLEELERLREADGARQPLNTPPVPGLLEQLQGQPQRPGDVQLSSDPKEKVELRIRFPETSLHELHSEAARLDRSVAWVVDQCWTAVRDGVREAASVAQLPSSASEDQEELLEESVLVSSGTARELFTHAQRLGCEPSRIVRAAWAGGRKALSKLPAAKR